MYKRKICNITGYNLDVSFLNTGRDFHMAKTEVPDTPKDGQTEV